MVGIYNSPGFDKDLQKRVKKQNRKKTSKNKRLRETAKGGLMKPKPTATRRGKKGKMNTRKSPTPGKR